MAAPMVSPIARKDALLRINRSLKRISITAPSLLVYTNSRCFTGKGIPVMPSCEGTDKDGFRIYRIPGLLQGDGFKKERKQSRILNQPAPPRVNSMRVDQDWTKVWPTASSFKPATVPLPIFQGFIKNSGENGGVTPDKYGNLELMKVPNFLHLTPRHISIHCDAIKRFCTQWPQQLHNTETADKHFPVSITTQDYVYSHSTIRDPRSRKVILKFKLSALDLDSHARDKIIRLLGERYDAKSDQVTLQSDKCPIKQQNTDYVKYLLTALYYESWKVEPWEAEKTWADMEKYIWDKSKAKPRMEGLVKQLPHAKEEGWKKKHLDQYAHAVMRLHNDGESAETITEYKKAVLDILNLKTSSQSISESPQPNS